MTEPETFKSSLPLVTRVAEQEEVVRVRMPRGKDGEILGIADQLLGASRIRVMCQDGKSRLGRIPGKLKKRMWIREGDLLVVNGWQFVGGSIAEGFSFLRSSLRPPHRP